MARGRGRARGVQAGRRGRGRGSRQGGGVGAKTVGLRRSERGGGQQVGDQSVELGKRGKSDGLRGRGRAGRVRGRGRGRAANVGRSVSADSHDSSMEVDQSNPNELNKDGRASSEKEAIPSYLVVSNVKGVLYENDPVEACPLCDGQLMWYNFPNDLEILACSRQSCVYPYDKDPDIPVKIRPKEHGKVPIPTTGGIIDSTLTNVNFTSDSLEREEPRNYPFNYEDALRASKRELETIAELTHLNEYKEPFVDFTAANVVNIMATRADEEVE